MLLEHIYQGCKLISIYMGGKEIKPDHFTGMANTKGIFWIENMRYNSSWGWIMPVIERINQDVDDTNESLILRGDIHESIKQVLITETFFQVVNFIRWYNKVKYTQVLILKTDFEKNLWCIYEESGQCVMHDLPSEILAKQYAIDNGMRETDHFNL